MLTAVQGYYDGNQIVLNERIALMGGQKVILTVFDSPANAPAAVSTCKVKQASAEDAAWQSFMRGIDGFTEDFMKDGRETELPSARETL